MKQDNSPIRLNRFIAMCGVCSRRNADQLISGGKVKVNSIKTITLGTKVLSKDVVEVNGQRLFLEKKRYVLLNKPKGYITTMADERGRKTVLSLIRKASQERIVPVGRLDKDTTGLLLFTNDGNLSKRLMHPKYEISKVYHVTLNKKLVKTHFLKIKNGLNLDDGLVRVDQIDYLETERKVKVNLHVGRNRIVRRIFEHFNYEVVSLDRVKYDCLKKDNLSLGQWRHLTVLELEKLNRKN